MQHPATGDERLEHGQLHQVVERLVLRIGSVELELQQPLPDLRGLLPQWGLVLIPALNYRTRHGVIERRQQRVRVGVEDVEGGLRGLGFRGGTGFIQSRDALADFSKALLPVECRLNLRQPQLHRGLRFHYSAPW